MMALDAMRSMARLAAAGAGVWRDERRARASGLPTSVHDVEPAWLGDALAARWPGVRIEGFDVLDDHSGTTSRARIAVRYAADSPDGPPATLFLKITPRARLQRLFLAATGIGANEVRFYRDVREGLPVRAPEVHGIACVPPGRQFVLLLEDLSAAGARLATIGDRMSEQDAERIIGAMACLHAAFWESERFHTDLAWVPCYESRQRDMPWERFITGQMVGIARRRYEPTLGEPLVRAAAVVTQRRDRLEEIWSRGPRTLVHGDSHLGNLFFDGDAIGFLDWQVCARAPGVRDVSYLLCNSLPSDVREKCERDLVVYYLDALRELGVSPPGFEAAFAQHRSFALYTFIAAAFTAAAGEGLQAREIAEAGLRRATRAVEGLRSLEALA